jgi:hypothetical protein
MEVVMQMGLALIVVFLMVFVLMVALARWILRLNEIVELLQSILFELKRDHPEVKIASNETSIDQTASFM